MIIRKKFRFEGAHIVRNCSSKLCRENIHGHSYEVEVFIKSNKLDKGFMVLDFILLSKVGEFINSFDHAYSLWQGEKPEIKDAVYQINQRVAEIPVSPSAEGYALMFLYVIDKIIRNTEKKNGEGDIQLQSVRVHETQTGYAEAFTEDFALVDFTLDDIKLSEGIRTEWDDMDWWEELKQQKIFKNTHLEN
ncbi:6-pyruvoyl tetrahydropterin synthase family protein [Prolixibacter sp. NT017]|uniref:6-pyruvoyl trahydropterin synthase family protein n=1 Tax=Prolixibacter sp. NT017 TaxID=2652390 RepID=UPI00127413F2|nr:6-pyruvoyl tetrahydropterin synthase family protein [Prolixibacter sp. NT017]GET26289.1 6-carboxytetrahydropterin synthase QueD [Prolixibacter sp. NT017]